MANNSNSKNTEDKSKEGSKKRGNGRRKIHIEAITDLSKKRVTFSKRRVGLFKKASELCTLCGVEMAILTFSGRGKPFCFGHPNPDPVVQRYLTNGVGTYCTDPDEDHNNNKGMTLMLEEHNSGQEEIKRKILEDKRFADFQVKEKKILVQHEEKDGKRSTKNTENGGFWWDEAPVDEMGLDELEQFMARLVELRNNVANKADELMK